MKDYTFEFESSKSPESIFAILLNVRNWWTGQFEEIITGISDLPLGEFTFSAGGGMHFSSQRLIELEQNNRIVWEVIESDLTFLQDPTEWKNTKIGFELFPIKSGTKIVFKHLGLLPEIECYSACSSAWSGYMDKLSRLLN